MLHQKQCSAPGCVFNHRKQSPVKASLKAAKWLLVCLSRVFLILEIRQARRKLQEIESLLAFNTVSARVLDEKILDLVEFCSCGACPTFIIAGLPFPWLSHDGNQTWGCLGAFNCRIFFELPFRKDFIGVFL